MSNLKITINAKTFFVAAAKVITPDTKSATVDLSWGAGSVEWIRIIEVEGGVVTQYRYSHGGGGVSFAMVDQTVEECVGEYARHARTNRVSTSY